MKIIEVILPFAINLITKWLSINEEKAEVKEKYLDFIDHLEKTESRSKRIEKQIEALREDLFK
tara:strand:+ start:4480 stop:4668 length:189 start_codon:yes stop_codon:yes gene_type:complete